MKTRIERLKKDTLKLFGTCFGVHIDSGTDLTGTKLNRIQTPDFYDSRMITANRKNSSSNPLP